jgi:hypothetical protein
MKLSDDRYRELASAIATDGEITLDVSSIKSAYIRHELEDSAGNLNEGTKLALYFQRKAPNFSSYYNILADKNLLKVAQIALGLPSTTSALPLEKQVMLISEKLKISDFKDPKKLDKFLSKFTARYEAEQASSNDNPVVSLLASLRATSAM